MEWALVLIIIMSSSLLFFAKTTASMTVNYVKPLMSTTTLPCPDDYRPCLTLGEYTSDSDVYFVNNTIFYFYPGIHRLDNSLILENLYNFSFHGLPNGDQIVNVSVDSLANITWNKSQNIEISSIRFTLNDHFTFIMKFERSQIVHLSNISIIGNGNSGCSSVLVQKSAIFINNSMFTEISGFLGAAVMMVASNVTFRGDNVFINNTAASGGSIYLSNSTLTFNGTSFFLNNTSLGYSENRTLSLYHIVEKIELKNGSGGAIFSTTSYLRLYEYSNFTGNLADSSGGAITMEAGALTIQGNASFGRNTAYHQGGAMLLNINSSISGNLYLNKNEAKYCGAICILGGEIIIQGNTSFDGNFAKHLGGALCIMSAKFIFYGNTIRRGEVYTNESKANKCFTSFDNSITFFHNTANYGGSIHCWECDVGFIGTVYFNDSAGSAIDLVQNCSITFTGDTYFYRNTANYRGGAIRCYDSNIALSGTVYFESNTAYRGGAMFLLGTSKLVFTPKLDISFVSNYANDSGGALYFSDYQCSLGSTVECFITIDNPFISTISNISLHFENNSAGFTGSILYGGQFDEM